MTCNGFVGADLAALCKEAAVVAVNRIFGDLFGVSGPTKPESSDGFGHSGQAPVAAAQAGVPSGSAAGAGATRSAVATATNGLAAAAAAADKDDDEPMADPVVYWFELKRDGKGGASYVRPVRAF